MESRKTILIIADTPLHRDPRVLVQIEALSKEYRLVAIGRSKPQKGLDKFIIISPESFLSRVERKVRYYLGMFFLYQKNYLSYALISFSASKCLSECLKESIDTILCNDVDMLPVASEIKRRTGAKLYLDCHEYTPRQWDGDPNFKKMELYWDWVMKNYVPFVDYSTVVCKSIGDLYKKNYHLECENIVMNLPSKEDKLQPTPVIDGRIRMVHHGGLNRNRKLENMIELMDLLDDRFTLDFYLVDIASTYFCELNNLAKGNDRINFHKPVPTQKICKEINQYDIGLFLLSPLCTNYRLALPNKFFEFIQARLGIAIWPSVEMKAILEEYNLGVCSGDFSLSDLAKKLNQITTRELEIYKRNSHQASEIFNSAKSIDIIRNNFHSF